MKPSLSPPPLEKDAYEALIPFRPGSRVGHRVHPTTGCWEWAGARATNGYGIVGIPRTRSTTQAHRFYFAQVNRPIPAGMDLDHLCRNRGCVNPAHLEVVTRTINARRGAKATLTEQAVRVIRYLRACTRLTYPQIARLLGSSTSAAVDAGLGRNWADVSAPRREDAVLAGRIVLTVGWLS